MAVGAPEDLPVDPPDLVPVDVRPVLLELDAEALVRRGCSPVQKPSTTCRANICRFEAPILTDEDRCGLRRRVGESFSHGELERLGNVR